MDILLTNVITGLSALIGGLLGFVLARWLETLKYQDQIRLKAEIIAELLAESQGHSDEIKKLNKLRYQAYLWLPCDIAVELSKLTSHDKDAKTLAAVLIDVRKHLRGKDKLKAGDIQSYYEKNVAYMPSQIGSARHE
ncbi:hypothetical protein [Hymenobacter sp. YC55]|uniref:hypothetical protein n=1 Tax=Hymenobacter sp. YC55 TaxID=3034019 RepID=UPI0023F851B1|nr:hypothetical protein [Hymenobacter sp. YC55]MDF7813625.1 hypothetical protein [Hymenobacter sp. YC55]